MDTVRAALAVPLMGLVLISFTGMVYAVKRELAYEQVGHGRFREFIFKLFVWVCIGGSAVTCLSRYVGSIVLYSIWEHLLVAILTLLTVAAFSGLTYVLFAAVVLEKLQEALGKRWALFLFGMACIGCLAIGCLSFYVLARMNALDWLFSP